MIAIPGASLGEYLARNRLSPRSPRPGVRISSGVAVGLLIKTVPPDYPDLAKRKRLQGQAILRADVDENGNVEHLKRISGDSMLATAAIEAVKQWKYKPYLLNGQTVKVETQVIVNFQLAARESSVEMAAGITSQQPGQLKWLWTLLTR